MQDRPEFDSAEPVNSAELTEKERELVAEGMDRRRALQAAEDELPEIRQR